MTNPTPSNHRYSSAEKPLKRYLEQIGTLALRMEAVFVAWPYREDGPVRQCESPPKPHKHKGNDTVRVLSQQVDSMSIGNITTSKK